MQRDNAFLLDMLIAARRIQSFTAEQDWEAFAADEKTQSAVHYQLQIIGEAAGKISSEFRDNHIEIPWVKIIGLRHRLVHDYVGIELPKTWNIVANYIQSLIDALEPLVPRATGSE